MTTFDEVGNIVSILDGNLNLTQFEYDDLNRGANVIDALQR